ncbi:hypothetical protein [Janibacter sp. GS2]|uniref:hypothetical protein n=1 Tax=Janibacter sp. GS2 TaxID=3442646 RepID=UPI003EBFC352
MTDDQDPTGMSHLLAGLKETGPVPDDLNERIRASLAGEQAARAGEVPGDVRDDADAADEREDAETTDRAAFWAEMDHDGRSPSRRTTPAGRWVLGIAAAAVIVMGIGGIFAVRGGSDDPSDSAAAGSASQQRGDSARSEAEQGASPSETPAFAITGSETRYSRADLSAEAGALYADPGAAKELEDPSVLDAMGTAAGAKDCLARLGNPELQPVVIDVAYFGETPGVLIIAEPVPEGTPRAWAVTTGCTEIWPGPTDVSTKN